MSGAKILLTGATGYMYALTSTASHFIGIEANLWTSIVVEKYYIPS
jgi:hypothetical protein